MSLAWTFTMTSINTGSDAVRRNSIVATAVPIELTVSLISV